jgi:peptidylprolyl isomerase
MLLGCEDKTPPKVPAKAGDSIAIPPATKGATATAASQPASAAASQAALQAAMKRAAHSIDPATPGYQAPPADVAAAPADAVKTASGLASKVLTKGTGKVHPKPTDTVKVHYVGWTTDGKMFDGSKMRNQPATFPLNRVIPGWTEGLQLMVLGETRRFWIPEELAYKGRPGPQGLLVFEVELLDIVAPPEAPKDVKAAPKDAVKTATGLASKVLKKGTGTVKPTVQNRVTVHYTGWTTDGKMFDSSVVRGAPATFPLGRVIPGWTEGVQLMVEGEKRRFWIPEELAYKGKPGPQGMLVFDVELIKIEAGPPPGMPGMPGGMGGPRPMPGLRGGGIPRMPGPGGPGGPGGHGPGDGHNH